MALPEGSEVLLKKLNALLSPALAVLLILVLLIGIPQANGQISPLVPPALRQMQEALEISRTVKDLQSQGRYDEAIPLAERWLKLAETAWGPNHPMVVLALNGLAGLYRAKGDFDRAEPLLERSLKIVERTLPPEDPRVALVLNNLAEVYRARGDYNRAEPLFRRVVAIMEKALGPEYPALARVLNNLVKVYQAKGDYGRAEPIAQRALAIAEKRLGPEHPETGIALSNLGLIYYSTGDFFRAEELLQRALTLIEKLRGPDHPDVAIALNNLATLPQTILDGRSEKLRQRALEIHERALGPNHPETATALQNLAVLYHMKGEYSKARPLYQRTLSILEATFGSRHPYIAQTLMSLAAGEWGQGNLDQAVVYLEGSTQLHEHHLDLILATGSEDQKLAYMATLAGELHIVISLHSAIATAAKAPQASRLALTTLLQRKGRVLDAMAESMGNIRARMNAQDRALFDRLMAIRTELASQIIKGPDQTGADEFRARVARLEEQAEELEAQASARSADLSIRTQAVTLERIQQAIPADAALVELVLYQAVDPKMTIATVDGTPRDLRYAAYILHPQGPPDFVDLGHAAVIDRTVEDLRRGLSDPTTAYVKRVARKLDEQVMRPIRPLLGDIHQVLLSPDGALNLIPFGALIDEEDRYLIERYNVTYLTSGRDLLRLQTPQESRQPPVIFADPNFGKTSNRLEATAALSPDRRSIDFSTGQFTSLPGTADEARAIKDILPNSRLLVREKATESALKRVEAPQILHVASHGFFLPDTQYVSANAQLLPDRIGPQLLPRGENPLLRSGLILAGANQLQSGGDDDGVLTALEASGLDLWGTKLVVLSACETGVGAVRNGEGVYGLRRALVIAGAQSQLMSLWKVADAATRDLMVDYYRRLQAGDGHSEALRQVQLKMSNSEQRSHPYFWASFIPSGAWGAMIGQNFDH